MTPNTTTVAAIYAAFAAGDFPAMLAKLSPDCVWEHDSVDHGIPWLVPRRGLEGVEAFFASLQGLEFHQFDVRNLLEGGNQVAGIIALEVTVKASGKRVRDYEIHLWTFDEAGQVVAFRHFVDTKLHHAALVG